MSMDVNMDIEKPISDSKKEAWSVVYWDNGKEPVITLFDNEESARNCYDYFKLHHDGCCIDKCNIFSKFSLT